MFSAAPSVIPAVSKSLPSFFKSRSNRFVLIGLVVVAILGLLYFFLSVVLKKTPLFGPKAPTVKLEEKYQNPFNRNSQYANPFDEFKNPFAHL